MTKFDDFLIEQLSDPELRAEYDALKSEFNTIQTIINVKTFNQNNSKIITKHLEE